MHKSDALDGEKRKKGSFVSLRVSDQDHEKVLQEAHRRSLQVGAVIPYAVIYREFIMEGVRNLPDVNTGTVD
jgi:hypothetical protein